VADPRLSAYDDPFDEMPTRRSTVEVHPVRHRDGRAWYWLDAIRQVYAACDSCRLNVPCWRHEVIIPVLKHRSSTSTGVERPDGVDLRCAMALVGHCKPATNGIGGIAIEKHGGGSWGSACLDCTLAAVGRVLDPETVTRG
jgi:hypothetical protein